jgi:hypothetical protein
MINRLICQDLRNKYHSILHRPIRAGLFGVNAGRAVIPGMSLLAKPRLVVDATLAQDSGFNRNASISGLPLLPISILIEQA